MAENPAVKRPLTAVLGPSGPETEEVHPFDQCEAQSVGPDGQTVRCPLPWNSEVRARIPNYDIRGTAAVGHPSVSRIVGRQVCWYHARLAQLNAERWDLPIHVLKIR